MMRLLSELLSCESFQSIATLYRKIWHGHYFALNFWCVNSDRTEKLTICACSNMAREGHFNFEIFLTNFFH